MVTTRPPFCGYNTTQCVELKGKDLSCYSNKIESVSLRNVRMISDLQKAYLKRYHGDEHLSKFLPPRWRQKSIGIDKKRLLRHCHRMNTLHDDKVRNRGLRQRSAADSSGVTSHRQPPQYRGAQGPKTAMGAKSDPNYVSKLSLDCVPVFHKIITPAYLLK